MNVTIGLADLIRVSPMIALFISSLIPLTVKVLKKNHEPSPQATLIQGLGGIIAAAVLLLTVYFVLSTGPDSTAFADSIIFDGVTLLSGLIALVAAAFSLMLMYDNPSTRGNQFAELTFLTMSSVLGMLVLSSAMDLVVMFIGLETMSLSLYLMIAMSHEERLSKEAAFKYFVLGGFASAVLLYGLSFIFGSAGTTHLSEIIQKTPELITSSRLFLFGMTLTMLGFCFKVSIFPFQAWTPDVYQGAPTPHSALMATAVKVVSFAAFLRIILSQSFVVSENLFDIFQWLAVLTMIVGNVAAILQNNFKRMLAYSSVAHSGYLLVGLITTGITGEVSFAASGVLFYLLGYSIMTLGAFALVSLLEKSENDSISIESLGGLSKRKPLMAFCLTLFLLSLAGIPPTVGFFGKFYLFSAAISQGLIWLALWGVLNSVISAYYYLRPIVVMYMHEGEEQERPMEASFPTQTVVIISAILVVILGVFSGPLFSVIEGVLS